MWRWILTTFFILMFCIGTSFITIPFAVSLAGFWPSVIAIAVSWLYLLITGFYYLEATLASRPGENVFSISKRYIGTGGAWISSVIFILVNYGYLIFFFYLAAPLIAEMLFKQGVEISAHLILFFLFLIVGGSLYIGLTWAMIFNFLLMLLSGWVVYMCFYSGSMHASYHDLRIFNWGFLFVVFPAILNTLYYHTFLPTVAPILKYNKKQLQSAIVVALTFSALLFIFWLWLTLSSSGKNDPENLSNINPQSIGYSVLAKVPYFGKWLPLLLILTTVATSLGIGAVLIDFFADLFAFPLQERKGTKRLLLCLLVFLPPWLLNLIPGNFIYVASLYITDIGPLYLAGLLPVIWVWSLRYYHQEKVPLLVFGGKAMLTFVGILSCFVFYLVGLEIFYQSTF